MPFLWVSWSFQGVSRAFQGKESQGSSRGFERYSRGFRGVPVDLTSRSGVFKGFHGCSIRFRIQSVLELFWFQGVPEVFQEISGSSIYGTIIKVKDVPKSLIRIPEAF